MKRVYAFGILFAFMRICIKTVAKSFTIKLRGKYINFINFVILSLKFELSRLNEVYIILIKHLKWQEFDHVG
jgi:hypothetical protein